MKTFLFVCLLAAAIIATQGYRRQNLEDLYNDEALEALEGTRDEPVPHFKERLIARGQEDGHNDSCDCPAECEKLHTSRLPHDVRVSPIARENGRIKIYNTKRLMENFKLVNSTINNSSVFISNWRIQAEKCKRQLIFCRNTHF